MTPAQDKPQLDKFKEVARELDTGDDPVRFKRRVEKQAKHKLVGKGD